jgi:lysophospholipase L1-like esterase
VANGPSARETAAFWAALPLVLPQALWVRRTATRFDGASGPNKGVTGTGDERRLLVYGDSIAAGVGAATFPKALAGQLAVSLSERLDATLRWQSRGYIGANARRLIELLDGESFDEPFDYVVLSVGVNDVTSLTLIGDWTRSLEKLLVRIVRACGTPTIALAGIPDMGRFPLLPQPLRSVLGLRSRQLDAAARRTADALAHVVHVPVEFELRPDTFSADGYHPSETSYRAFAGTIADALVGLARAERA